MSYVETVAATISAVIAGAIFGITMFLAVLGLLG